MSDFDYAHPIRDNTRDEVFAVPICNCLFNTNIAILKYMQRNRESYIEKYPFIDSIDVTSQKEYLLTEMYSDWEFLFYLRYKEDIIHKTYEEFLEECGSDYVDIRMKWDPVHDAPPTNFFGAISHLLTIEVIKRLYLYDSVGKYDKALQALIISSFGLEYKKHFDIQMLNCENGMDLYSSEYFKEITTFVLDSNEDLFHILSDMKEKGSDAFKTKYFILPKLRLSNYTEESIKAMSPHYWILKHSEYYMELEKDKEFNVGYYLSSPL